MIYDLWMKVFIHEEIMKVRYDLWYMNNCVKDGLPKEVYQILISLFPLILWLVGVILANRSPCNTCLTTFLLLHWLGPSHTRVILSHILILINTISHLWILHISHYITISNHEPIPIPLILKSQTIMFFLSYYLVQCHSFLHFFILAYWADVP